MCSSIGPLLCVCTGKKPSGRNCPPQVNRGMSLCAESSGPALDACGADGDRTLGPTSGLARRRARARRAGSKPSGFLRETLWTSPPINPLTRDNQPHTTSGSLEPQA